MNYSVFSFNHFLLRCDLLLPLLASLFSPFLFPAFLLFSFFLIVALWLFEPESGPCANGEDDGEDDHDDPEEGIASLCLALATVLFGRILSSLAFYLAFFFGLSLFPCS